MGFRNRPIAREGNSSLERLPVELFRQVTGYLAFFDKKAIQAASKKCYSLTGPFMCPHILLWMLHCCRSGMPSRQSSNIRSDVVKLNALTSDCLARDTWIDLSQGQEARDAHLAFQEQWNTINLLDISRSARRCIMCLLSLEPRPPGWQQTVSLEMRFALLQKMFSHLSVLKPNYTIDRVMDKAGAFERHKFGRAPDRATYEEECRRSSSVYISPILQPYFNEAFPKSTVAHLCFSVVIDFAESVVEASLADANNVESGGLFGENAQWHHILQRARAHIEKLENWTSADGRTKFSRKILLRR